MLPNRKYLIHKAVEYDKLTRAGKKRAENLYATHFLSHKYDGCNMIVVLRLESNGQYVVSKFSRTGEVIHSMDHIDEQIVHVFKGYAISNVAHVILGEAWQEGRTQQQISGDFRRHSPSPGLRFVVFDHLSYNEFLQGKSVATFGVRYAHLQTAMRERNLTGHLKLAATFNPGSYGDGRCLRDRLLETFPVGYDGVIYREDCIWEAGSGTGGGIIKDKPYYSFDLLVTGIQEGTRANKGKVGSLVLQFKDGTSVEVGTGLTAKQRQEWWDNSELIVGKIVQVAALGFTGDGKSLREPRFKGIRFDKEAPDY